MTDVGEARTPQEGTLVEAEANIVRVALARARELVHGSDKPIPAEAAFDSLLAYIKQLEETGEGWYQDALREGKQREAAEAQVKQLERRLREAELPTVEEIQGIYTEVRLKDELLAAEAQVKQLEGERDAERHRAVNAETLLIRERRGQRTQA